MMPTIAATGRSSICRSDTETSHPIHLRFAGSRRGVAERSERVAPSGYLIVAPSLEGARMAWAEVKVPGRSVLSRRRPPPDAFKCFARAQTITIRWTELVHLLLPADALTAGTGWPASRTW